MKSHRFYRDLEFRQVGVGEQGLTERRRGHEQWLGEVARAPEVIGLVGEGGAISTV